MNVRTRDVDRDMEISVEESVWAKIVQPILKRGTAAGRDELVWNIS